MTACEANIVNFHISIEIIEIQPENCISQLASNMAIYKRQNLLWHRNNAVMLCTLFVVNAYATKPLTLA